VRGRIRAAAGQRKQPRGDLLVGKLRVVQPLEIEFARGNVGGQGAQVGPPVAGSDRLLVEGLAGLGHRLWGRERPAPVASLDSELRNQFWENEATRQQYVVAALKNRRRISSEGMHVRTYLDAKLAEDVETPIIVLGDLNDGPGLDYFEEYYLSHNVTDILIGSAFQPEWLFVHAQHDLPPAERYTAVFDDFVTGEKNKQVLLDHILLSPGLGHGALKKVPDSGRVRHAAEYDAEVANNGVNREDRPSDHRPVSVQLVS
jgi:hypothetical protein